MFSKTTKILAAIFAACATGTVISGAHDKKVERLGKITEEDEAAVEAKDSEESK